MQDEVRKRNSVIISIKHRGQLDLAELEPGDLVEIKCSHGTVWAAILKFSHLDQRSNHDTVIHDVMVSSTRELSQTLDIRCESGLWSFKRHFKVGDDLLNMGEIRGVSINSQSLLS